MMFEAWLKQQFQRFPTDAKSSAERAQFTAQVMERVRELPQPEASPIRESLLSGLTSWLTLPRVSFAFAAAAAVLVVMTAAHRSNTGQLAVDLSRKAAVLAALSDNEPLLENDIEALADEVDADDQLMMLAENTASTDDATWVEQMSQLIDQLDDSAAADSSEPSDSNWQEELEMLDEADFSASS